MSLLKRLGIAATPLSIVLLLCGFKGADAPNADPPMVITAAPVYEPLAALRGGERFPQGAQLQWVRAGHAEPVVTGFAATADASISFDGKTMLIAGKKTGGDHLQVW